jgi:hypothetical protein
VSDAGAPDDGIALDAYVRAIESHVCRQNDGHLIRIAGPTFDLVRGWAEQGVPLKVALAGIDRTFERYYRKGPRRRPLQVTFCDADVLDAFDDWRRAMGLSVASKPGAHDRTAADVDGIEHDAAPGAATAGEPAHTESERRPRGSSLPQHLERVASRLTLLRGDARNDPAFEAALSAAVLEIDSHRQDARQARGSAREMILTRLEALDEELLLLGRARLSPEQVQQLVREAADTLAPFRERMAPAAYHTAHGAALARLVREHTGLPVIRYDAGS